MSVQRLAGQAWNGYKNNLLVQDVVETAIATLGIAGAQALFTDMSPTEIAISAGLGAGAATVGRPLGDRAGRAIGRMADQRFPGVSKGVGNQIKEAEELLAQIPGGLEASGVKTAHHFAGRGPLEGMGSLYGRLYGDNAVQAAVGLAASQLVPSKDEAAAA